MKRTVLVFLFMLCLVNIRSKNVIDSDSILYPSVNTPTDKIIGLSTIWSEIKYNFVNIDRIDFNIDSLYEITLPKVLSTTNDLDYYDELKNFLGAFNDGHTELLTTYNWNAYNDYTPAGIIEIDKKFYISSIRKNAALDSTLLGAEIIEIENMPTSEYVKKRVLPTISASTESHRWYQAPLKLQQGRKGTFLTGRIRKRDGSISDFSIPRNGETTRTDKDEYWGALSQNKRSPNIDLKWSGDIAILEINAFYPETIITKIDSLAAIIKDNAKGLIIDLRRNGGGSSNVAFHLQKYITRNSDKFLSFGAQMRINDSYGRSQGNYRGEYRDFYLGKAYKTVTPDTIKIEESIQRFSCPIVILIGRYTFSAAEDFLINLYEVPNRPLLIGEATGGSTGAPLVVNLPNNGIARICAVRMLYPYSLKPFANEGIQPDIVIKQNIDDYLNNQDVVLEKAIDVLKDKK